jgi:hypothetical protein
MGGKRADSLLEVMGRIEQYTLRRVWDRLGDDELFWEPVPGSWGVRRRDACESREPFGSGEWVVDFDGPVSMTDAAPMTTIGWLLWHIASMPGRLAEIDFLGGGHTMASGWTSPYLTEHPIFIHASDAIHILGEGWKGLKAALDAASDDRLETLTSGYTYAPQPPINGHFVTGPPGPQRRAVYFVAGVLNEVSHHGSQICTLRDLYARR